MNDQVSPASPDRSHEDLIKDVSKEVDAWPEWLKNNAKALLPKQSSDSLSDPGSPGQTDDDSSDVL